MARKQGASEPDAVRGRERVPENPLGSGTHERSGINGIRQRVHLVHHRRRIRTFAPRAASPLPGLATPCDLSAAAPCSRASVLSSLPLVCLQEADAPSRDRGLSRALIQLSPSVLKPAG